MTSRPSIVLLTPELSGGIRTYVDSIWPALQREGEAAGFRMQKVDCPHILAESDARVILARLKELQPSIVHVQHEFGLFGSKIPPFYRFPDLIKVLREGLPHAKIVATGHTILGSQYLLPWRGRGWQTPIRWGINHLMIPGLAAMRRTWMRGTWGLVDGVIVHSRLQEPTVRESGCPSVRVIPHYVPTSSVQVRHSKNANPKILVFGYFSPEKGQDVIIRALAQMVQKPDLILAGGVRRVQDQPYLKHCENLIDKHGLKDRVRITGFVPDAEMDALYAQADLVVAPFRETSGSGSLAQALSRGAAILASDLPLNQELNERVAGAIALFRSGDFEDCATKISSLLADRTALDALSAAGKRYAEKYAPTKIAQEHIEFYRAF